MNCADFRRVAPDLLYRLVPSAERGPALDHLQACGACRDAFGSLREKLCSEIHDALDDYLEATMAPSERATFDAHLAVCPECRDYLASYEATIRLGKAAHAEPGNDPTPPPELIAAVLAARRRKT
ncbi:MAG TPA: zf-HC2 domain-containing protein [Planctomycetota bacterium]|nr:zf-HC2 domain-containing protein [Planctomycetota bacterium]